MPLPEFLAGHIVETVYERGWSEFPNGNLPDAAEEQEFEVFITTDQNLRFQQNLGRKKMAFVVLLSTSWNRIQLHIKDIKAAINASTPGSYREIRM